MKADAEPPRNYISYLFLSRGQPHIQTGSAHAPVPTRTDGLQPSAKFPLYGDRELLRRRDQYIIYLLREFPLWAMRRRRCRVSLFL